MYRFLACLPGLISLCVACASQPAITVIDPAPAPWYLDASAPGKTVLGIGDRLNIHVPGAPELSQISSIGEDGQIVFSYIGPVLARGRTTEELAEALTSALSRELRAPAVEVQLLKRASLPVYIGGAVDKPGLFDTPADSNLLQALILAGVAIDPPGPQHVILIRQAGDGPLKATQIPLSDLITPPNPPTIILRRFDVVILRRDPVANLVEFANQIVRQSLPDSMAGHFTTPS